MIGFLGFDAVHSRKLWSEDDIRLLKLIGEIFANALDRKSIEVRLQDSLKDKEVLMREIHHRVKNNMQIVNSLLYLQEQAVHEQPGSVALDAFQQSRTRIKAMATIHDRLNRSSEFAFIDFKEYFDALIPELLKSYGIGNETRVDLSVNRVRLGLDAAVPCALMINELVTNCLKHAFPDGRQGMISLTMEYREEGGVRFVVADDGIGMDVMHQSSMPLTSLGLLLVADLARQLDGSFSMKSEQGTRVQVDFLRVE